MKILKHTHDNIFSTATYFYEIVITIYFQAQVVLEELLKNLVILLYHLILKMLVSMNNDFDVTWSSPPCTEYIIAKQTGTRKIDEANEIVKKAIEIINYFDPNVFVKNPPRPDF